MFGAPEVKVTVKDGRIAAVEVLRGAPCGATWEAAQRIVGCPADEAPVRYSLETQYFCSADPSNWDPLYGKSPVHFAADVHKHALRKALESLGVEPGPDPEDEAR
ncbi:protein of unknown function [Desulfacinum infernum DSM 9756]|jgi:hypothetical protein|uniref:Uncharacterized protein n=3 Tax=Desulfacinum infernum TaxID=35837 RepID=A0A1M5HKZ2_9BACT|nr:hypothetical protein [Desulfacinum sp.]SHG16587.1 protein of unknown function [Desulfacinum infernum DSM 9756]